MTDFGQWGTPSTTNTPKRTQVVSIGGQGGTQSQTTAIGVNDLVYHDIRSFSAAWAGWEPLAGFNGATDFSAYAVVIATMPDGSGSSQIIATGLDGMIYHDIRSKAGVFAGWEPVAVGE